jgi:hypothetical protein
VNGEVVTVVPPGPFVAGGVPPSVLWPARISTAVGAVSDARTVTHHIVPEVVSETTERPAVVLPVFVPVAAERTGAVVSIVMLTLFDAALK